MEREWPTVQTGTDTNPWGSHDRNQHAGTHRL